MANGFKLTVGGMTFEMNKYLVLACPYPFSNIDWLGEEPRRVRACLVINSHHSRDLSEYVEMNADAIIIECYERNGRPVVDPAEVRRLIPNTPVVVVDGQPNWAEIEAEIEQEAQRQTS